MSDWQAGDLALCVKSARRTISGAVYTVARVIEPGGMCGCGEPLPRIIGMCLMFDGVGAIDENGCEPWSSAIRFRKIRPHTPDAEDAETIRLLNGAPVSEPVA